MAAIVSITEQERAKREEAYRDALTNLRLEGLEMDEQAKRILQRHVNGEITSEEFRAAIDDLNERKLTRISIRERTSLETFPASATRSSHRVRDAKQRRPNV